MVTSLSHGEVEPALTVWWDRVMYVYVTIADGGLSFLYLIVNTIIGWV